MEKEQLSVPGNAPPGAIVSPDTRRDQRIPPGQSRTQKWPVPEAFVPARGCDRRSEALNAEYGGQARLIVPLLYAWKSAKWSCAIELLDRDQAGFRETNGYHMHGDPWLEERHSR